MPLRTAKTVLQFCTAFEDRLDGLYSTDRIDENCAEAAANNPGTHFNAGLAWHFQNNKATDFGPNVFRWLASSEEASSYKDLGQFFRNQVTYANGVEQTTNAHYSTLNLDNLYGEFWQAPKGTIEFRQHGGTLDIAAIFAHVELKRAIVTYCHFASDLKFLELCQQVSNPDFKLSSLCQAIGLSNQLIAYHKQRTSVVAENRLLADYHSAIADLAEGKVSGLEALKAQSFIEHCERNNWAAVSAKIHSKKMNGAYADLTTAPFDFAGEYNAFLQFNRPYYRYPNYHQLSTLARTMVFQQLNGSDSS